MTRFPAFGLVILVLSAACQRPATPPAVELSVATEDPGDAAQRAFDKRDWQASAALFREAIVRDGEKMPYHYRLAISATWLEDRAEAAREFQWVFEHAAPGTEEYQAARSWLTEAGLVRDAKPVDTAVSPEAEDKDKRAEGRGGVTGTVVWAEGTEATAPKRRQQLHLIGLRDTPSQGQSYVVRTDEQGHYQFKDVRPGPYKLTNTLGLEPTWRMKVEIKAGGSPVVDLSPDNSVKVRDDFRDKS
jgi:hypothetical protein